MRTEDIKNKKTAILLGAVILAAVIILVLISSSSGRGKTQLGEVIPKELKPYNDNVLLVSAEGIQLVDSGGNSEWSLNVPSSDALVRTRGKYIVIADLSTNKINLAYDDKQLCEYASATNIISANVNKRGDMAVACDDEGYKGMVVLLDKKGREKYRWHCNEGYLTDVDLSSDGRYVAASLITTDERTAGSKLVVLDTKADKLFGQTTRPDTVMGTVRFTDSGKIVTVSDSETVGYNKDGKVRFEVSFGGRSVSEFNIDDENNMAFAVMNNKNNTTLEIYSRSGKLKGSYEASGELKHLSSDGGVIAASLMRDIYYISSNGKLKNTEKCEHEIKDLCLFGGGRRVFAAGGSGKYSIVKIR